MSEYVYDYTPNKQHAKEGIVRCRDCKRCMAYSEATYCDFFAHRIPSIGSDGLDGFCAWGERMES